MGGANSLKTIELGGKTPKATFLLVAYNQQGYIREAVEGALSQTYEPLEIILSDDCSTDRTFEIMQEVVSAYQGPHTVRLQKTPENLGLLHHVIMRGQEASGDIVVLAAGDDVSLPQRTEMLVAEFSENTGAVFSTTSLIDENGIEFKKVAARPLHLSAPELFLSSAYCHNPVIQGCSAAYQRWVFDVPINPAGKAYPEDVLFSFYISILGFSVGSLDTPLVQYRAHSEALSNVRDNNLGMITHEQNEHKGAGRKLQLLGDLKNIAQHVDRPQAIDTEALEAECYRVNEVLKWSKISFLARSWRILAKCPNTSKRLLKWQVLRLWGRYPRYQPKLLLTWLQSKYFS